VPVLELRVMVVNQGGYHSVDGLYSLVG
jgi:hypothetical protein